MAYLPRPASGGGAPTGPAGGDLSGTYPNPTVVTVPSVSDVTNGTYTVGFGVGAGNDGTLTFVNGRITAIQQATVA